MLSKEVSVVSNIGQGKYYREDGSPCCAVGWYRKDHPSHDQFDSNRFLEAYREAYRHYFLGNADSVEYMNDRIVGGEERAKVYNLANAILGYTEGQSEETLKALKEIKNAAS